MRFFALLFAAFSAFAHADADRHDLTPATPAAAPALELADLDGKSVRLADYAGKVVLVNFWATWCPPCRREMPSLERLSQRMKGEAFVVLAVAVGQDADTVREFLPQLDPVPGFPVLLDTRNRAMRAWKAGGLPYTAVVDARGQLVYTAAGGRQFDHPEMLASLRALLPE